MHDIWCNYDVLYLICSELPASSVASFARTCRVFFGVAIHFMWRNVPDFDVLGRALREAASDKNVYPQTNASAPLDRFTIYCSVIQSLQLASAESGDDAKILPCDDGEIRDDEDVQELSVLQRVSSIADPRDLFPSLGTITITAKSLVYYRAAENFMTRSVTKLVAHLKFDIADNLATELLSNAIELCPDLRHIDFQCSSIPMLDCFRNSRVQTLSLSIHSILDEHLDILADIPTLRDLKLCIAAEAPGLDLKSLMLPHFPLSGFSVEEGFKRLERLSVTTKGSLYVCIGMLKRMTDVDALRYLHVDSECYSVRCLDACVAGIADRCRSLTKLEWRLQARNASLNNISLNWSALSALQACRGLEAFHFTTSSTEPTFLWRNADLKFISLAFPKLKRLRLITFADNYEYFSDYYKPYVTLEGLWHLAKNRPELELVQVEFDASNIPDMGEDIPQSTDLKKLGGAWCRVPDNMLEPVAAFIHNLWPSTEIVWGHWFGGQLDNPSDDGAEAILDRTNGHAEANYPDYSQALRVAESLARAVSDLQNRTTAGSTTASSSGE